MSDLRGTLDNMAGGMNSRRGEPLAQRVANTRARQDPPTPPVVRHCWYVGPYGRQAALLLSWRRITPDAPWEGRIAVVAPDEAGGWSLVTMWVTAGMLEPATVGQNMGHTTASPRYEGLREQPPERPDHA